MSTISPDSLRSNLQAGLGALCWWDLADTAIEPCALRAILAAEGDPAVVPDVDPASAVRRAAREWASGRGNDVRHRAEVVAETPDRVEVGVLRRERVTDHEVRWIQVDHVSCEIRHAGGTSTLGFVFSTAGTDQALAVEKLIRHRAVHLDADWIRPELIQKRLDQMGAFNLRRQGGVVYVPGQFAEELDRLARVVRRIGESSFSIAHLDRTPDTQASVGASAKRYLEDQLGELSSKLDEWEERAKAPRGDAFASLLEQVGDLVLRGDLYREALSVTVGDLDARLVTVRQRALALLTGEVESAA